MKAFFNALASLIGLFGVISLFLGLFTWNMGIFFSGIFGLANAYAWSLVGDLSEKVEQLERKTANI